MQFLNKISILKQLKSMICTVLLEMLLTLTNQLKVGGVWV